MSEEMRVWVEIAFNISYLVVVWSLVALMMVRRSQVAPVNRALAQRILWAFALLALGDTGHVGFRVVAYAQSGIGRAVDGLHGDPLLYVDGGYLALALQ